MDNSDLNVDAQWNSLMILNELNISVITCRVQNVQFWNFVLWVNNSKRLHNNYRVPLLSFCRQWCDHAPPPPHHHTTTTSSLFNVLSEFTISLRTYSKYQRSVTSLSIGMWNQTEQTSQHRTLRNSQTCHSWCTFTGICSPSLPFSLPLFLSLW
jgi:L-rhamnose mutarotase